MADKRRGRVREPLSGKEVCCCCCGGSIIYYSPADLDRILATFTPKPGFDRAEYAHRLDVAASAYVGWLDAGRQTPPSQVEQHYRRLFRQIEAVWRTLNEMSPDALFDLEIAGSWLAMMERMPPPGYQLERMTFGGSDEGLPAAEEFDCWPVRYALEDTRRMLVRLARCAEGAAITANRRKASAGGNRPIAAEHLFFQTAVMLLYEYSVDPLRAYEDKRSRTVRGNLIDFLEACLYPLDYSGGRKAIYKTCERIGWKEFYAMLTGLGRREPATP